MKTKRIRTGGYPRTSSDFIVFSLDMTLQVMRILSIQMESFPEDRYVFIECRLTKIYFEFLWKEGFTQLRSCSLSSIYSNRA